MPIEPDEAANSPPPLRSQLDFVRTGSNARWGAIVADGFIGGALVTGHRDRRRVL